VQGGDYPDAVEDFDAYLLTGSDSGAYDSDPWIGDLRAFLQAAKGRAALVGVCFGHQIMADAFGGLVIKSPKGRALGLHEYAVEHQEPWMDSAPSIRAPAAHGDQVVEAPPGARVVAGSDFTPVGMLAYGDQPAISIQLHPEFEPDYARALIELRRGGRMPADILDKAEASLAQPDDRARLGDFIGRFLRSWRQRA
jgi:GMP synthase-like glutamine amidotransferase